MYGAVGKHKDCSPTTAVQQQQQQQRQRHGRGQPATCASSAALAHSVLLEFNLRWNLRMMVKNRGLPAALGGHYNEYLMELIQRATADWEPSCPPAVSGRHRSSRHG
ncbi:unnamed protein product [Ectocarpus fasciculatus]